MPLNRWLWLIGGLVAVGGLQVAQRNALFLEGYAVGERLRRVHEQETQLAWLQADVVGLASPARLAEVAQERRLKLVAWSTLSPARTGARALSASAGPGPSPSPLRALPAPEAEEPQQLAASADLLD